MAVSDSQIINAGLLKQVVNSIKSAMGGGSSETI